MMQIINNLRNLFFGGEEEKEERYALQQEIMREYDVRGIFGKNLFARDAYEIGRAFGTILERRGFRKACVGFDCRNSSQLLRDNLVQGLLDSGREVTSLGLCHTPLVYYSVYKLHLNAGVMITGSHNSPEYNGFKFMVDCAPFYAEDIRTLGKIIDARDYVDGSGREIVQNRVFSHYVADLLRDFAFSDELKIAWDVGNGATSRAVKTVITALPGKHHVLFEDINGDFPNRLPDPTVAKNVEYLAKFVPLNGFDIGFAFDSDGDRLGVVNSEGKLLFSDQVLEVLAVNFLRKNPGAQIIADVKSCNRLFDVIKKCGGVGLMERVGHSFIKARMKETGALLAGEISGHFFFRDRWFGFDDGVYAALRCLEILSHDRNAFSHLEYGFVTPEIRIVCDEDKKNKIIESIRTKLKREEVDFNSIDGVRVSTDDGWWLLRASNTQNAISVRMEAYSAESMAALKKRLSFYLSQHIKNIDSILGEQ
ncbi:MAG: phosphomannomutase/phosphoglucomutase [Holosporaceae bacterium]|jgi:phosphomannomutase|nr:phosphomannomutase/phosphoglucomutase [Holosporaceae bacterium]